MLIDFHTHVYPEKIAQKGVQYIGDFYNLTMREKGTLVHLKSVAKASGTTHVVLLGVAVKPEVVESINRFTASMLDASTFGFGTIHPDYPNKKEEICHCLEMGLTGIKIHPDMQAFNIDDDKALFMYDEIGNDYPIVLHVGDKKLDFSNPERLSRVLEKFPEHKFIAAHMGGYSVWDKEAKYLVGKNVWFDTSSTLWEVAPDKMVDMIRAHGADKVLFGSDYPAISLKREAEKIEALALTEEEKEKIFYTNAKKLLELE